MPAIILWFLGILLIIAESVLISAFGVLTWTFQIPIALTIYIGLKREFVSGALTLSALLLPIEWLVGGAMGFYSLGLVAIFFLMRLLKGNVQAGWGVAHALMSAVCVLFHGVIMIIGLVLFHSGSLMIGSVFWSMWTAALTVALVTVILGKMLDRIESTFDPRSGRSSIRQDF